MANHKQAKKRIRQSEKRRVHNRHQRSKMRTTLKNAQEALQAGGEEAVARVRLAEREIRKATSKGLIPKNRASRTISRLAKRLNAQAS